MARSATIREEPSSNATASFLLDSFSFLTSQAPELQDSQGYKGQPADIWSLGVITYALLSGTTPFRNKGDDAAGLLREQMTEKLDFSRTIWNGISEQAKGYLLALEAIHRYRRIADRVASHQTSSRDAARSSPRRG